MWKKPRGLNTFRRPCLYQKDHPHIHVGRDDEVHLKRGHLLAEERRKKKHGACNARVESSNLTQDQYKRMYSQL